MTRSEGAAGWRIVRVVADSVNEAAIKRAEFGTIIRTRGFDALLEELDAKTAELAGS